MKKSISLIYLSTVICYCSGAFCASTGNDVQIYSKDVTDLSLKDSFLTTNHSGGFLTLSKTVAGHFRVEKIRDRWWFITPEGKGIIMLGVNHIGALRIPSVFDKTIFAKKYGKDWPSVYADIAEQLSSWGFNNLGYDQPEEMHMLMPYLPIKTFLPSASFYHPKLIYVDVFSPAFSTDADIKARATAEEMNNNPLAIAWTWDDCICWDLNLTRKSHNTDWVSWIRGLPSNSTGRQRYTDFLKKCHSGDIGRLNTAYGTEFTSFDELTRADWSRLDLKRSAVFADDREFLRLIAREYFSTISKAFRKYCQNGLLMGPRFHFRDHPDEVLEEAARYIDVLGIQNGDQWQPALTKLKQADETWFDSIEYDRLYKLTGKPIVIVDHQCGFYDSEMPKTGPWHQYANAEEAAVYYDRFLHEVFARPYIIGYMRCQLISVWNEDIKRFKQGLLRPDGTPFEDYIMRITKTNGNLIENMQIRPSK